jgi:hypothetical protein
MNLSAEVFYLQDSYMLYRILNAVALILPDTLSNSEYNNPYSTTWLPMPEKATGHSDPLLEHYMTGLITC